MFAYVVAKGRISDKEVIADCCWALSYHSSSRKSNIDMLLDSGIVPKVVEFMTDSYLSLVVPCVRIVGNISNGSAAQTEELIKNGVLDSIEKVVKHSKKVVRR